MKFLILKIFFRYTNKPKCDLYKEKIKNRQSGYLQEAGWLIQYCFGKDQTDEYLDYYAAHRMTDDSHVRIYADGKQEKLQALSSIRIIRKDPIENKRLEEEFDEHNRKV